MLPTRKQYRFIAVVAIIAVFCVIWVTGSSTQVAAAPPTQAGTTSGSADMQDPATCGACHAEEYELWQKGAHAQASTKTEFQEAWDRVGRQQDCLACHTTGYDPATGQELTMDVTCLACHQKTGEQNHPPALMSVNVTAENCGQCHENTYQEWLLSQHGQRGIECASCHMSHSQALRIEPAEQLCGQCHGSRFEDAAHSSHTQADLTCTECHMPANPAAELTGGMGGVSTVGHTFNVGSQTCAECHMSQIHGEAADMASTQNFPAEQAGSAETAAMEVARERVNVLSSQVQDLQQQMERQRILTYVGGAFGLGIGVFVGLVGTLMLMFALQRRGS